MHRRRCKPPLVTCLGRGSGRVDYPGCAVAKIVTADVCQQAGHTRAENRYGLQSKTGLRLNSQMDQHAKSAWECSQFFVDLVLWLQGMVSEQEMCHGWLSRLGSHHHHCHRDCQVLLQAPALQSPPVPAIYSQARIRHRARCSTQSGAL